MNGRWARLEVAGVLALATVSSAVPILVGGWWLGLGTADRYALAIACWASVLAGLVARARRPENPIGNWFVVSGLLAPPAWLVGGSSPVLVVVSGAAFVASATAGAAIPISFPTGRLDGRAPLALAAVAFSCLTYRVQEVAFLDPAATIAGWKEPNPWRLAADPGAVGVFETVFAIFGIGFMSLFAFWLARRWWRLTGLARRSIAPVLWGALLFVAASIAQGVVETARVQGEVLGVVQFAHALSFSAVPVGILAGLLRVQMARSAVAGLVVDLGETPEPAALRRALATALGDPSLEVLLWTDESGYVDAAGERVESPEAVAGGRAVTLLERGGEPLAAILHDPALLDDPGLVTSVATAVRLAVENDRLTQEVKAQLAEVRASRTRIVEATDAERRRLERDIHDGAQQRLVSLSFAIGRARSRLGSNGDPELARTLADASDEVRAALSELRELARGIHPAVLTQAGLGPAVRSLAERSAVPADLDLDLDERLPPAVEATAYFVVSEALANVAKHAGDCTARVSIRESAGWLIVDVTDDGPGGADPALGSGLGGLRDRVEAIGGELTVVSPVGLGTRIAATIPISRGEA